MSEKHNTLETQELEEGEIQSYDADQSYYGSGNNELLAQGWWQLHQTQIALTNAWWEHNEERKKLDQEWWYLQEEKNNFYNNRSNRNRSHNNTYYTKK